MNAKNESKTASDLEKSQVASSVAAGKPGSTASDRNLSYTLAKSDSAPTELAAHFGRYRVIKKLGGGGMGTVYLVENTELEREEALKVPHFGDGDDPQLRERFLREAKSAAKLDHPNLCQVYDAGVQDGFYYITMRFLNGKLLSDYTDEAQPARKAVEIVIKLAQALEAAHAKGVIHRDLKPSNIMMVADVGPVVMDFGLAKQVRQADQKLTQAGSMVGTPAYMPPEQVKGELERMGPASDIYSLGVILYQLLTGRLPFEGPVAMIFAQILFTEPPSSSALVAGLDPAIDAICRKAMAKESAERYPSMKAFAGALTDSLHSTPATAGAGNLAPTARDKADGLQTPASATSRRPAGNSADFQSPTVAPGPLAATKVTPPRPDNTTSVVHKLSRPTAKPSKNLWLAAVASLAVGLLITAIVFWAVGVIRVRTADGYLVVEVNEPNPDLYVDGDKVTVAWQNGGMKAEVAVKPGTRKVELKKDGFRVYGEEVTLEDHGRTVLVARLEPSKSTTATQVAPAPSVDASKGKMSKKGAVETGLKSVKGDQDRRQPAQASNRRSPSGPPGPAPSVDASQGETSKRDPVEKGLKSLNANVATTITFINKSRETIKVYWIDYEGVRKFYQTLQDGQSCSLQTFLSHPWVITDEHEKAWYVYLPEPQPKTIEIVAPVEKGLKSLKADVASTITFINQSGETIKVYWIDYEGARKFYQTLRDGQSYRQPTFLTHPWVITDEHDKGWYVYLPEPQPKTIEIVAPRKK